MKYDVVALGELLIDFTENGVSEQGNPPVRSQSGRCALQCAGNAGTVGTQDRFYWKSGQRFLWNTATGSHSGSGYCRRLPTGG